MFSVQEAVARFFPAGADYDRKEAERLICWLDSCGYAVMPKASAASAPSTAAGSERLTTASAEMSWYALSAAREVRRGPARLPGSIFAASCCGRSIPIATADNPQPEPPNFEPILDGIGDVERQRLDGRCRVHAAARDPNAAVDDEEIFYVVAAAPFSHHGTFRTSARDRRRLWVDEFACRTCDALPIPPSGWFVTCNQSKRMRYSMQGCVE